MGNTNGYSRLLQLFSLCLTLCSSLVSPLIRFHTLQMVLFLHPPLHLRSKARALKTPSSLVFVESGSGWLLGLNPSKICCSLIKGLADLEAALCLCIAIKANVLGVVKLNVSIALSLLVNSCGKRVPYH
ncbi:putative lipid-binding protein AIR1 [Morus notabilis]|uniref:putative lipid-binding protein AIR1 n=1 Tax=Morus notabilis TaxID=981085 RepID=UPI000CED0D13|nr:putative lipid-binding protein AIR1 [Morus notabilis]